MSRDTSAGIVFVSGRDDPAHDELARQFQREQEQPRPDQLGGRRRADRAELLHHPPDGFMHAGSFKTLDHDGNLQLTFFSKSSDWLADIDIDDAKLGLRQPELQSKGADFMRARLC
jgi:hypothetical protein